MKRNNGTKTPTGKSAESSSRATFPAVDSHRELKPNADDIQRRAYEIYLERMARGEPGSCESDWSRAERELARG
jgi:hypothetical protein